jgi:endonuclease YncB( thermonuclease family)
MQSETEPAHIVDRYRGLIMELETARDETNRAHLRAAARHLREHVVSIADGDTLTILDADKAQHKIRFAGIDAPEKSQPFGTKAREALAGKGTASPGSIAAEAALAHRVF